MATQKTYLYCDNCTGGIVTLVVKKIKKNKMHSISSDVIPCTVCQKYFRTTELKELKIVPSKASK